MTTLDFEQRKEMIKYGFLEVRKEADVLIKNIEKGIEIIDNCKTIEEAREKNE